MATLPSNSAYVETHFGANGFDATIARLREIARKSRSVHQGAAACGKAGTLLIVVSDEAYDKTVLDPQLDAARQQLLTSAKRALQAAVEDYEHVQIVYAALDFAPIFALLRDTWSGYDQWCVKFILGYDRSKPEAGRTRYCTIKLLFLILQQQLGGIHCRADSDVADADGRGLATMIRAIEAHQRDAADEPWVASLNYLSSAERKEMRARLGRGELEEVDALTMCRGYSIRPLLAVRTATIQQELRRTRHLPRSEQLAQVNLLPTTAASIQFVKDAHRMIDLVNQVTGQNEDERVVSGALLHVNDVAWQPRATPRPSSIGSPLTLLDALSTWADDAVLARIRPGCKAEQIPGATVTKERTLEFSGDVLQYQATRYLAVLLRGMVLIGITDSDFYPPSADAVDRAALWDVARRMLRAFVDGAAAMDGTVLQTLVLGRGAEFAALQTHGFVSDEFAAGVAAAVDQMFRHGIDDENLPVFCQTIRDLIDDLELYAQPEFFEYYRTLLEITRHEDFPLRRQLLSKPVSPT